MMKIIFIIGVIDGIGLLIVEKLVIEGYIVLLYGCSVFKLEVVVKCVCGKIEIYIVDLIKMVDVYVMVVEICENYM